MSILYRPETNWSNIYPIPKVRNRNDQQASLSVGISKTSDKGNLSNTIPNKNVPKTCNIHRWCHF